MDNNIPNPVPNNPNPNSLPGQNSPNQSNPYMASTRPKHGLMIFLVTFGILLLLGVALFFFMKSGSTSGTNNSSNYNASALSLNISGNLSGVYDCSTNKTCFEEKFSGCEKANITATFSNDISNDYVILGPMNGKCEMMSIAWLGGNMTCLYDNSKSLDNATAEIITSISSGGNIGQCQGNLYDLLSS